MILVRDRFQLKFGKAREAKDLIKGGKKMFEDMGNKSAKAMTDLTGRSYTLVLESEFESLSDFEKKISEAFKNEDWKKWYQKFAPLVESADREIFTIIE